MKVNFSTSQKNTEFAVAMLALGLIEGMKSKSIPLEIGIWSLGRPRFWSILEKKELLSKELLLVIQKLDELTAMKELDTEVYKVLDNLSLKVRTCLQNIDYQCLDTIIDTDTNGT